MSATGKSVGQIASKRKALREERESKSEIFPWFQALRNGRSKFYTRVEYMPWIFNILCNLLFSVIK
jgi:hypothetical protein